MRHAPVFLCFTALMVTATFVLLDPIAVYAADPGHGEAHQAGLPQLDPTWFPSQIFWMSITFVFLYAMFSQAILPAIATTLESRREQIESDLDAARSLKEEAEQIMQEYDTAIAQARQKALEIYEATQAEIKAMSERENAAFMTALFGTFRAPKSASIGPKPRRWRKWNQSPESWPLRPLKS